jgi:endonuclease/exonuclease/phosphatase family metal-dependent hydrolase
VFGFLLALSSSSTPTAQGATTVKVVTVNTAKGDGQYACRLEILAEQLRALDADLVLLQEAFAACDRSLATAPYLADALGLEVAFARARRKPRMVEGRELFSDSGLAILSRRPLIDATVVALPWSPADGERIAQIGLVADAAGPILVVNTHLTHLRDGAALRRAQLATIARHPWLGQAVAARLLCGDLNATLDDPELEPLVRGALGWDVLDTYAAGGGGSPRETIDPRASLSGHAARPRCIDYILSLARTPVEQPAYARSAVVLNRPDALAGLYPSDHFGVMTTLDVPARQPASPSAAGSSPHA